MYQPCMELVNYSGNSSCDEHMYQPYMECQKINLVIVHVMNIHLEAFVSYLVKPGAHRPQAGACLVS